MPRSVVCNSATGAGRRDLTLLSAAYVTRTALSVGPPSRAAYTGAFTTLTSGTSRRDSTAIGRCVAPEASRAQMSPRFHAGARSTNASRLSGTDAVVTKTVSTLTWRMGNVRYPFRSTSIMP